MFKHKFILQIILACFSATLATALIVSAATTIGANISTDGSLTVSGTATSTFGGGINISSGCYAKGGDCLAGSDLTIPVSTVNGGTGLTSATAGYFLIGNSALALQATSTLFITPAGNVGIGTTSPNNLLQVKDLISFDTQSNTWLGDQAGKAITSGSYNTAVGKKALTKQTTAESNVAIGYYAAQGNIIGTYLTAVGTNAGYSSTGDNNTFFGTASGFYQTSGTSNVFVGSNSGIGINGNSTASYLTGIGESALRDNTTGNYGVGVGYAALQKNSSGASNTGVGSYAGYNNLTGGSNTIVGYMAGFGVSANSYSKNSLFGRQAGYALTAGSNNTLLGYYVGDNITTGSNNIIIGYDIEAPATDSSNMLNIGNLIFATGLDGTGTTLSSGNVGIGTTTPLTQLQVTNSSSNATTTLEFGKTGQSKGSCLKMYDAAGTVKYVSIVGGSFNISDTSCQ